MKNRITSATWWRAAGLRALYTAIAVVIPYLGATVIADISWLVALSAAAVGAIASLATSLAGLPESDGVELPWWLAALERVGKTFGQALAAGLTGAVLITDVDWALVLQSAAMSAFISLLRLILATLPAGPTAPTMPTSDPVVTLPVDAPAAPAGSDDGLAPGGVTRPPAGTF
ncbi:holin [Microbacterium sp. G2-8]|uniref:holin n=1 Tax=Microbacterium sp. G2-8 TaxID=2842454 RepID=UPI001C896645|nr:holin [Microbacterium sp. G2-8]